MQMMMVTDFCSVKLHLGPSTNSTSPDSQGDGLIGTAPKYHLPVLNYPGSPASSRRSEIVAVTFNFTTFPSQLSAARAPEAGFCCENVYSTSEFGPLAKVSYWVLNTMLQQLPVLRAIWDSRLGREMRVACALVSFTWKYAFYNGISFTFWSSARLFLCFFQKLFQLPSS